MQNSSELSRDTQLMVHQLKIVISDMWNVKKSVLTEDEVEKMLDIQETVEALLLRLNDGSFSILTTRNLK